MNGFKIKNVEYFLSIYILFFVGIVGVLFCIGGGLELFEKEGVGRVRIFGFLIDFLLCLFFIMFIINFNKVLLK